jgi:hypothetical protein
MLIVTREVMVRPEQTFHLFVILVFDAGGFYLRELVLMYDLICLQIDAPVAGTLL